MQGCNFSDINNDGNLDAFVCNDVDHPHIYTGDGLGGFAFNQALMSIATNGICNTESIPPVRRARRVNRYFILCFVKGGSANMDELNMSIKKSGSAKPREPLFYKYDQRIIQRSFSL
ncbi:hypothetical protein BH11BAC7_BH11BAC7_16520 [soil metagenome]